MGLFDGQDGQQQPIRDKAKQVGHEASERLSHIGTWIGHKAHEVANSEQMSLAGHATRDALNRVRESTGLTRLDLSHNPLLSDRDLSAVSAVRTLTHLDLGFNTKLTDQGLRALSGNHDLKHLNLENTLITGATFALLPHTALASLILRNDRMLNIGSLAHLTNMPMLERLDLSQNRQITDAALPHLKMLTQVKDMDLRGTGLSQHALAELKHALPHAQIRY